MDALLGNAERKVQHSFDAAKDTVLMVQNNMYVIRMCLRHFIAGSFVWSCLFFKCYSYTLVYFSHTRLMIAKLFCFLMFGVFQQSSFFLTNL